tara:strand:+ start:3529 stop:3948 length:420 start_codon:yes stop_codon:yes gene_type:complete
MRGRIKKERICNFKFGDNLYAFFWEMRERGFEVTWMGYGYEEVRPIDFSDLDEVTYQAQNFEGCNVTLFNKETGNEQTVAVNYTGDAWCDVVPIVDWTFKRDSEKYPDVVDGVITMLREEFMLKEEFGLEEEFYLGDDA